jgi:hypothetical protein
MGPLALGLGDADAPVGPGCRAVDQPGDPGRGGRVGDGDALGHLPVGLAGLVGQHAEHAIHPGHRRAEASRVVQITLDQLGAQPDQRGRGRVGRVADQRMHVAATVQQMAGGRPALPAGPTKDQDGAIGRHGAASPPATSRTLRPTTAQRNLRVPRKAQA